MADRDKDWKNPDNATAPHGDANPDPITGAPGSHPVGTGVGAVGGGIAGTVAGAALAGAATGAAMTGPAAPIGGVIGAVIGAVAGGLAGKGVAETVNPTEEDAYWRENYKHRPYYESGRAYDDYRPAYEYGWETRGKYAGRKFEDVESDLRRDWEGRGSKAMSWDKARDVTRDAWARVDSESAPGVAPRFDPPEPAGAPPR